jgi:hypothetical protein
MGGQTIETVQFGFFGYVIFLPQKFRPVFELSSLEPSTKIAADSVGPHGERHGRKQTKRPPGGGLCAAQIGIFLNYIARQVAAATVTWKALRTSFSSSSRMPGFSYLCAATTSCRESSNAISDCTVNSPKFGVSRALIAS